MIDMGSFLEIKMEEWVINYFDLHENEANNFIFCHISPLAPVTHSAHLLETHCYHSYS